MDPLSEVFEIEGIYQTLPVENVVIPAGETEESDFDTARKNTYELIEQGRAAINTAMHVAAESNNPRALEVLGNLIKTMADVNKQLLSLSKDKADIKSVKSGKVATPGAPQIGTVQNAVFVGDSASLNKLIKGEIQ